MLCLTLANGQPPFVKKSGLFVMPDIDCRILTALAGKIKSLTESLCGIVRLLIAARSVLPVAPTGSAAAKVM